VARPGGRSAVLIYPFLWSLGSVGWRVVPWLGGSAAWRRAPWLGGCAGGKVGGSVEFRPFAVKVPFEEFLMTKRGGVGFG
jgi:hypothetical protein